MSKYNSGWMYTGIVLVVAIVAVIVMIGQNSGFGFGQGSNLLGGAASTKCIESDTGKDFFLKGTTIKGDKKFTDACADNGKVVEYYCEKNNLKRTSIICEKGCKAGACIKAPTPTEPICGNRIIDEDETCDGNIKDCRDKFGNLGIQNCTEDCEWEDECWTQNMCGDRVLSTTEHCEGTNLGGKTCQSFGYTGGSLKCSNYCKFDTTSCTGTIPCEIGTPEGLVEFTFYTTSPDRGITDSLRDGETKTYTIDGKDYEITAVQISANNPNMVKLSINGYVTPPMMVGTSQNVDEGTVKINEILTNSGTKQNARVDFFLVDVNNGGSITDYLRDGETKTYTVGGRDYEVTAVFISSSSPGAAKISVNGVMTKELKAGEVQILGGPAMIGIYNIMTCTLENNITNPICNDTDSGKNYNAKGTVYTDGLSKTDSCSGVKLTEYYCDSVIHKNGYFVMRTENTETLFRYMYYSSADRTVTLKNLAGDNYAVSVAADNSFELIFKGISYGFELVPIPGGADIRKAPGTSGIIPFEYYTCANGCSDGACLNYSNDLSKYPSQYFENGAFTGKIVVGSKAPASDIVAAIDLMASLQHYTTSPFPVGIAVLDVDVPNPKAINLISVGNICSNMVTAELYGNPASCTQGFTPRKGKIQLFNNNGKTQIVVAGYDSMETLAASYVLTEYQDYKFTGRLCEMVVVDLNTITVACSTN